MQDECRYFEIAGITVQVESDLPFTDATFDVKFESFRADGPGDDTVFIRHHFELPDEDPKAGGEEVYRRPPWAIYRTDAGWVYEGIAPEPDDRALHRVAVFDADHMRGELYNPAQSAQWWRDGGLGSLTMFPSDQIWLARLLADRDGVTFRAQGTCMYPTVRPGDVLRIRSSAAAAVAVGDIAVCRTPQYLFSHRVIETGQRDGRAFVVTRPDRAHGGGDAPTFDDDLLGVVVSIERDGKSAPLQPTEHETPLRAYHRVRLAFVEAQPRLRTWVTLAVERLQTQPAYGALARRWYVRARPRLRLTVRVPLNATLGDAVSRELEPSAFDPRAMWHGRPIERWTLAAHVNDAPQLGAWVTFVCSTPEVWCVEGSNVRARYRGSGLDETIMRQAEAIARRSGASILMCGREAR